MFKQREETLLIKSIANYRNIGFRVFMNRFTYLLLSSLETIKCMIFNKLIFKPKRLSVINSFDKTNSGKRKPSPYLRKLPARVVGQYMYLIFK